MGVVDPCKTPAMISLSSPSKVLRPVQRMVKTFQARTLFVARGALTEKESAALPLDLAIKIQDQRESKKEPLPDVPR